MGLEPSKLTPRRTGTDTLLSALKNFEGDYFYESAQRDLTINWKTLIFKKKLGNISCKCLNDLKRKYLKNFSIILAIVGSLFRDCLYVVGNKADEWL